jgi:RNA polymerase sigma factor (sigma-70 family)
MIAASTISSVSCVTPATSVASTSVTSPYDDGLSAFMRVRPRLFGIAHRMLGSVAEAEDIVQDVWLRWQTADRRLVRDAAAFLSTTTTRLAINVMKSARSRRETCVGPWLPEPVDTNADTGQGAERSEALECAVLILQERLSPAERTAYVLREAFDYPYRDIANILRLKEPNTRQLVTRARQRVANGRRAPVSQTLPGSTPPESTAPAYSMRSAFTGSIRAARCVGRYAEASATQTSTARLSESASGS